MSKMIKVTEERLDEVRKEFNEAIKKLKLSDGKITYTKNFGTIDKKATLYFTELAYWKMLMLVDKFDKEVAWHGIAKRGDDPEKNEYIISDILVYPQMVTGANVETDQEKYQTWLMSHDDEVFNNIRMQGHSHVNMSTSPSSVDTNLYDQILQQLDDSMFYIFLIWNKSGDKTIKIYDMAKNVLFETADITVKTLDDGSGIGEFLKNADEMVQNKVSTYKGNSQKKLPSYDGGKGKKKLKKKDSYNGNKSSGSYYKNSGWGYGKYYDDDFDDYYKGYGMY